jgi:hypothetical protein
MDIAELLEQARGFIGEFAEELPNVPGCTKWVGGYLEEIEQGLAEIGNQSNDHRRRLLRKCLEILTVIGNENEKAPNAPGAHIREAMLAQLIRDIRSVVSSICPGALVPEKRANWWSHGSVPGQGRASFRACPNPAPKRLGRQLG